MKTSEKLQILGKLIEELQIQDVFWSLDNLRRPVYQLLIQAGNLERLRHLTAQLSILADIDAFKINNSKDSNGKDFGELHVEAVFNELKFIIRFYGGFKVKLFDVNEPILNEVL